VDPATGKAFMEVRVVNEAIVGLGRTSACNTVTGKAICTHSSEEIAAKSSIANVDLCASACGQVDNCLSFLMNKADGACSLKNKRAADCKSAAGSGHPNQAGGQDLIYGEPCRSDWQPLAMLGGGIANLQGYKSGKSSAVQTGNWKNIIDNDLSTYMHMAVSSPKWEAYLPANVIFTSFKLWPRQNNHWADSNGIRVKVGTTDCPGASATNAGVQFTATNNVGNPTEFACALTGNKVTLYSTANSYLSLAEIEAKAKAPPFFSSLAETTYKHQPEPQVIQPKISPSPLSFAEVGPGPLSKRKMSQKGANKRKSSWQATRDAIPGAKVLPSQSLLQMRSQINEKRHASHAAEFRAGRSSRSAKIGAPQPRDEVKDPPYYEVMTNDFGVDYAPVASRGFFDQYKSELFVSLFKPF